LPASLRRCIQSCFNTERAARECEIAVGNKTENRGGTAAESNRSAGIRDNERAVGKQLAALLPDVFFTLSSEVAPQIREYPRASTAAVNAYAGWGAYGASKAALLHLGRIWDEELRGHGVRVTAFDPGDMDTPMHAQAVPDADLATLKAPAQAARELIAHIDALSSRADAKAEVIA